MRRIWCWSSIYSPSTWFIAHAREIITSWNKEQEIAAISSSSPHQNSINTKVKPTIYWHTLYRHDGETEFIRRKGTKPHVHTIASTTFKNNSSCPQIFKLSMERTYTTSIEASFIEAFSISELSYYWFHLVV